MTAFSPPPDLDARHESYAPFAEWQRHLPPMKLRRDNLYPALTAITQQRIRQRASQLVNALAGELTRGRPA